jgi:hypothetical protein
MCRSRRRRIRGISNEVRFSATVHGSKLRKT